jgi:hypothetical protein
MKHIIGLAALSLFTLVACGVDPAPNTDEAARAAAITATEDATAQTLTCTKVWECDEICGTWVNGVLVRYSTNVLHEYCSDGSDTIKRTDPCGEACF